MLVETDPTPWREALLDAHRAGFAFLDVLTVVDRTDLSTDHTTDQTTDQIGPWEFLAHVVRPGDGERRWVRQVRDEPRIESVGDVFAAAAWHEREVAEMFGIEFTDPGPSMDPGTDTSTVASGDAIAMRPLLLVEPVERVEAAGGDGVPTPAVFPLRKRVPLLARITTPWPGFHEPGGDDARPRRTRTRRALRPPGVPEAWLNGGDSVETDPKRSGPGRSANGEGDHG